MVSECTAPCRTVTLAAQSWLFLRTTWKDTGANCSRSGELNACFGSEVKSCLLAQNEAPRTGSKIMAPKLLASTLWVKNPSE